MYRVPRALARCYLPPVQATFAASHANVHPDKGKVRQSNITALWYLFIHPKAPLAEGHNTETIPHIKT